MAEKKDPTKITLREAAELYRKDLGTQKITRFNAGSSFAEYGDMTVVEAFTGERGERPIDKMGEKAAKKSPGAYNDLMRDLRFVSIPVRREIALAAPDSPILSSLPAAEAAAEQTKIVLGPLMPTAVEADIRILTANKKGWGELFTRLEDIASDPNNPRAAVADALLTTFYTGPRGGLIANLKGHEYKPESGSIRVVPQTKAKRMAGEAGEAGAQKTGGIRQAAIPYNVPLNEDAVGYIERRMKYNEANPDIVKFIRDSGTNHIFVKRNAKGKPTKVSTTDMSQLLGEIEVSQPLIEDAVSGQKYNSLYPTEVADKTAGKWGEALARNFHASVGILELKIEGQTMDFLQGRSETSGTEGRSQTKKLGYAKRPTDFFTPGERDAQQQIANWINSTTGRTAADIPGIEVRISPATYAIPGFFDTPVEEAASPVPTPVPVEKPAPTNFQELFAQNPELRSAMEGAGFEFKPEPEIPDEPEVPGDGKPGFGRTGAMLTAGVAGTAAMLLDPAQALADEAIQQTGEAALRPVVGAVARRFPIAEVFAATETGLDPQERLAKAFNMSANDFYQMTPEEMAPYQQALDDAIAKQEQEAIDRRRGRNRARVGKGFLENQLQP